MMLILQNVQFLAFGKAWIAIFRPFSNLRERENSNSKTLFYKDCSLGSVKTRLTTSPLLSY